MNKSLYHFGVFFLGLTAACSLFQGSFKFLFGAQIFTQGAFIPWFLMMHTVSITGVIVVLKYYYYRKYWAAFYTGITATIGSLCYAAIFFIMLLARSPSNYYIPVIFISLCISVIYALILMFSGTGKKVWLRIAGAYMLVVTLVLLIALAGALLSKDVHFKSLSGEITEWASMAGSLISIPFIMHLRSEAGLLNTENTGNAIKTSSEGILITVNALALLLALGLGGTLTVEGSWAVEGFENVKKMARLFDARAFVNNKGDTLFYRLLKPLNYDPKKKYPLVVSLPYGGQPATDKIRQIEGAAAAEVLSTPFNRKKYPAFIFVPNCRAGSGWGGIPNYPSKDPLVYEAITALDTAFSIDAKRRYVTGISMGGYGTWHFICTRPDMFAAAIPVCGGGEPKLAPRLVHVAVWAFHGAKDHNVPVSGSRGIIEAMRRSGQKPKYTEYPSEGHNIWQWVNTTPGLWDWLFAQKRDQ